MSQAAAQASTQDNASTLLVAAGSGLMSTKEIKESLEKGDVDARIKALKHMIRQHLNGELQGDLLMTVIRYITPIEDNHDIKKLHLYFWETIDPRDAAGNLLSECILICSHLRKDLQHPNEYVRGITLRFLCKVRERDLLEPLIATVLENLKHRVTYVRRSAVLATHAIFMRFPHLIPDAPELIETFITEENDVSARRNAFDMLAQCSKDRAIRFLTSYSETHNMAESGDVFQLSVLGFIRQTFRSSPRDRARYVTVLFSILHSRSPSVRYQCATTLMSLSASPTAIRQAAQTYLDLLKTQSDNSVRLIIVDQLMEMRKKFLGVLQESLLDLISTLGSGTMEFRKQVIALTLGLVSGKCIDAFVQAMKKELVRSEGENDTSDSKEQIEYRLLIIKAIRTAVIRNLNIAGTALSMMMEYCCDPSEASYEVICFVREVMHLEPSLRRGTLERLAELFPLITSPKVLRTALWLMSVHCTTSEEILSAFSLLKSSLSPVPLTAPEGESAARRAEETGFTTQAVTTVREDGTYATTYTTLPKSGVVTSIDSTSIRAHIVRGDYFVAAALGNTLSKLVVQLFVQHPEVSQETKNACQMDALDVLRELVRYGTQKDAPFPIDADSHEHIRLATTITQNPHGPFLKAFVDNSLSAMSSVESSTIAGAKIGSDIQNLDGGLDNKAVVWTSVDAPVFFSQLAKGEDDLVDLDSADSIGVAIANQTLDKGEAFLAKLEKTVPLSGFSDAVYCEASITVHQFDVSVDWYLVNQTGSQLENLTIEVASLGDMKLYERPQRYSLAPHASLELRTSLKVSSTETGVIYGSILFNTQGGGRSTVILNDIHVDIMDYINPAPCRVTDFRNKWSAFDWENKIGVDTDLSELRDYVEFVVRQTNMQLLEPYPEDKPGGALQDVNSDEDCCDYVSCSLYARTVFGEDALANISVEKDELGHINGVVRIRSNTQAIAYGIGERLNMCQKASKR